MSDSEEVIGGCLAGLVGVALLAAAVATGVVLLTTVGSVFGIGTALRNYFLAFRNNVKQERVTT